MPQIAVDEDFALLTVGRCLKHFLHRFLPALAAVMTENYRRFAAQFQQETRQPHDKIRVAIESEFLTVQPGMGIQNHVHQTPTLQCQFIRHRFAG